MRLPDSLYQQVKTQMAHHMPWHIARWRREWLPPQSIPVWQAARNQFPNVKYLDQAGSGDEFLRFHRMMVRHFKWILQQNPQSGFTYTPWTQFPAWLESSLQTTYSENYMRVMRERITVLTQNGTADQLGNFIEGTSLDNSYGSSIHNNTHGEIADYEERNFPNDPRLVDASMGSPDTAHHNEHFWGLHGWIDEILANWQRAHGENVDQTPLNPAGHVHGGHTHLMLENAETGIVMTDELRRFAREILRQ
ncbi:MAG TPA: hypothetical protein VGC76_15850 [Pyrinomonadaceae bacterium]|jgi:hypothetical protein